MNLKHLPAMLICCILITASHLWAADQIPSKATQDYTVGPGDVLDISVWNNEALTKSVTVLPDGKFHFPLIGEVIASGKTLDTLKKELKNKINVYEPNPVLSVMVQKPASMMIYVIGAVQEPGMFSLNTRISLLQALAMAGGFNEWAKKDKIQIFRESGNKTEILNVSYDAITKDKKLDQNVRLKRGDVVVVPD